jgi:hypothetical protein
MELIFDRREEPPKPPPAASRTADLILNVNEIQWGGDRYWRRSAAVTVNRVRISMQERSQNGLCDVPWGSMTRVYNAIETLSPVLFEREPTSGSSDADQHADRKEWVRWRLRVTREVLAALLPLLAELRTYEGIIVPEVSKIRYHRGDFITDARLRSERDQYITRPVDLTLDPIAEMV